MTPCRRGTSIHALLIYLSIDVVCCTAAGFKAAPAAWWRETQRQMWGDKPLQTLSACDPKPGQLDKQVPFSKLCLERERCPPCSRGSGLARLGESTLCRAAGGYEEQMWFLQMESRSAELLLASTRFLTIPLFSAFLLEIWTESL